MKKLIFLIIIIVGLTRCQEVDFADNYSDPNKIDETTVPKQFSGMLIANEDYVTPNYWNYFVVLRTTLLPWTQAAGYINGLSQYQVGAASVDGHWNTYYNVMRQYREMEKVYDALSVEEQQANRIYMLTGTIYLYDHTQKMVDLFGSIPFSDAGRLSQNSGDYLGSLPAYDGAEAIYTTMLDELKSFSTELNSISLSNATAEIFETQDFINGGDVTLWTKYCNSLRLRILNRVSESSAFSSRADGEMSEILGSPGSFPVIDDNSENIQIEVVDIDSPINSKGFEGGLASDGWYTNFAGKKMIDFMNDNTDPRIRVIFEPGEAAGGVYEGIDPLDDSSTQTTFADSDMASIFNRTTLSQNEYFPGVLMNAAEVNFLKAEYYLRNGNDAMAKDNYEMGIKSSTDWYFWVTTLSVDDVSGPITPLGGTEVADYLTSTDVVWGGTDAEKLNLIATQKWIHYSVVQLHESWAEERRLDLPALDFAPDNSNTQTLPPVRWLYPDNERSRNTENYQAVSAMDNMTSKMFWDVN